MVTVYEDLMAQWYDGLISMNGLLTEINLPGFSPTKRREILEDLLLDWQTDPTITDEEFRMTWVTRFQAELEK